MCMAPHRLAIALQDDGWWVRADIVWHKPNPMPSSVTDRPTPAKEYVFLLSKAPRYFYDAQAIAEPSSWQPDKSKMPDGWDTGSGGHGSFHREGREKGKPTAAVVSADRKALPGPTYSRHRSAIPGGQSLQEDPTVTRNARDVWVLPTEPFPDAHYATFPSALAERCIKAGCPEGGTVLDPFGGSGTVGMVADRLGRDAILIDINEANREMAERRLARDRLERKQGTMADVAAAQIPLTPLEELMQGGKP
jgi:site-specific DNA-methyltransferase (cytosine-N4-specific)